MPAKQVTKDSKIEVPGAVAIPGASVHIQEAAVQAVVDTIGQDTPPEALFAAAPAEPPVEILKPPEPHPGSVTLLNGAWVLWGEAGTNVPYEGAMIEFIARDPGLMIELGDVQVRFDLGRVKVPEPVAERLKRHFLYSTSKFYMSDEVAIIGNEIVSYRDHAMFSASVARMKAGEVVMYATKVNPNLVMNFMDFEVRFEDGYAAVEPDKVERFERHMFVRDMRVTRLQAV